MASTSGRPSTPDRGRRSSPAAAAAAAGPVESAVLMRGDVALAQDIILSLEMGEVERLKKFDKGLRKTKSSLLKAVAEASPQSVVDNLVHKAAVRGLYEMCKYLIKDLKLDVNGIGENGATPLISAIDGIISAKSTHKKKEYERVVELFIRRGASPNGSKPDGFTPLHAATLKESCEIAKILLDNGANVNAMCPNGTVIRIAVESKKDADLVKFLHRNGFAAMHIAALKGSCAVARLLLENGAEVDIICDKGTPLHIATESGVGVEFIVLLLENNANPNMPNINGFTALHLATLTGASDVAKLLLTNGAEVNASCQKGTPLHLAAECGDMKMLSLLLQHSADTSSSDLTGRKAIEVAAMKGFRDCVETLFQHTAPLNGYADWSIDGIMQQVKNQNIA